LTAAAPYPADTSAKGWRFELDYERIRRSDTWALASPEVRPWLLMLWMTAWEQVPCGSLPAEDLLIAARIGMLPKVFSKHRPMLMRGWWLADDGKLYHATLVERVQEMLQAKHKERDRKAEYRKRMDAERAAAESHGKDEMSHGTTMGQTRDSGGTDDTGTGTGTGTGLDTSLRSVERVPRASRKCPAGFEVTDDLRAWAAGEVPGVNLRFETDKFRDHTYKTAMTDWAGAWRNWMRNASGFGGKAPAGRQPQNRHAAAAAAIFDNEPAPQGDFIDV
jgi:hypothetical protein